MRRKISREQSDPRDDKKIEGKYVVLSEHTGRKFGTYSTKKEAVKRLGQVEFFKHLKAKK